MFLLGFLAGLGAALAIGGIVAVWSLRRMYERRNERYPSAL